MTPDNVITVRIPDAGQLQKMGEQNRFILLSRSQDRLDAALALQYAYDQAVQDGQTEGLPDYSSALAALVEARQAQHEFLHMRIALAEAKERYQHSDFSGRVDAELQIDQLEIGLVPAEISADVKTQSAQISASAIHTIGNFLSRIYRQ